MKIYLASASPRRRELLEQIGLEFEVKVSHVEERAVSSEPGQVVEELSAQKAEAVLGELLARKAEAVPGELLARKAEAVPGELTSRKAEAVPEELTLQKNAPGEAGETDRHESGDDTEKTKSPRGAEEFLVIGADTVVELDGSILGKPADRKQAFEMLGRLAGRTHRVYTGVTLLYRRGEGETLRKTFHEMTRVSFYPMSENEITCYLNTGDCLDKAGAYGIQGFCARYIRGIEGDYSNVVGLPVGRLYQEAKEWLGE